MLRRRKASPRDPALVQAFYTTPSSSFAESGNQAERGASGAGASGGSAGRPFSAGHPEYDNLHERAGNRRVIHMHGELLKVSLSWSGQVLEWTGDVTAEDRCHCCQFPRRLRPHVVCFAKCRWGWMRSTARLADADIFIAIGTSGHVYPALLALCTRRDCTAPIPFELNLSPASGQRVLPRSTTGWQAKWYPPLSISCCRKTRCKLKQPAGSQGAAHGRRQRCADKDVTS